LILPFIVAICLCGVFCLIPLALYLWWLAQITRREHPKPIAGQWDFVGLLLGLSGFVVFGGGLLLTLCQSNFRYWMRGNAEALRGAWIQERVTWALLVAFYLIVVAGIAGLTLAARRRTVVVYNVEPAVFETLLTEVFDQLGRPVERRGRLWVGGAPLCELDTFEGGHTVTLRWVSEDVRLFEEVDRQLRAALATQPAGDNPASRWLTAAAVGTGASVACCFGLLLYGLSLLR
jgi:hypothetical protein